jgi:FMN reductase
MRIALLGGSLRDSSVSARTLELCAELCARRGVQTSVLTASQLVLPPYVLNVEDRPAAAHRLLSVLRAADGIIIATPTYHGGMSGLLKNALDHVEDLAGDTPSYLDGRVVGAVAVGWSEHGAASAVADVRNTIMALRGWVTPMAVTVNSLNEDVRLARRLEIMVKQVVDFALLRETVPYNTLEAS